MINMELNRLDNKIIEEYISSYGSNLTLREFLNVKGLCDNYRLPIIRRANYKEVYDRVLKGTRVAVEKSNGFEFMDKVSNLDGVDCLYIVQ